ncbi:MAG: CAP domain-containing protein [Isosphaeraceae bacterium]
MQITTRKVWTTSILRACLACAALAAFTTTASAQTYYYPSSVTAPTVPATATPAPVYYVPAGSQNPTVWSGYAPQYYQTSPVAPVYVTTQSPQYYQTGYVQPVAQNVQYVQPAQTTVAGTTVVPTSYVAETPAPPAAETTAAAAPAPATTEGAAQPAAAPASDAYGFLSWLNSTRAAYGLSAVGYDANLESWASANNAQQAARGMGHYVMGPARRQNSAMGGFPGVEAMWMASPAHRAALLDPTIQWIGIAGYGAYWTFNAY